MKEVKVGMGRMGVRFPKERKEWRYSAVVDFGCVSFRILWINSSFQGLKYVWWWGYGPNKGDSEERDRFWNDMDKNLDIVGNGYRLYILGDLKGWIGDGKEPA